MKIITVLWVFTFICSQVVLGQDRMPTLEDSQYKLVCGPIAGVVALRSLGIETSLEEMAQRCQWEQDKTLPLENLQRAISSYRGISCQTTQLTPTELCDLLKDHQTMVILAIRKKSDEVDHAVCAVGAHENDQIIHLIDYPELHQRKLVGEIADKWDGSAIVVRISPFYRVLGDCAFCFAPFVLCMLVLIGFRSSGTKKETL